MNLSLQDCLDMSDLSDAELLAIARHEKIPPIVALELGHRLIQTPEGVETLRQFILDDILGAQRNNRCRECEQFSRALADYSERYPEERPAPPDQAERLCELFAIGQSVKVAKAAKGLDKRRKTALREIDRAKERNDCCACGRLSLEFAHLLDEAGKTKA